MKPFARLARHVGTPNVESTERSFSFFAFVDDKFSPSFFPLKRILSQVRAFGVKTMLIEELDPSEDIVEENEDIRTRHPVFSDTRTLRLSFFTKEFTTTRGLASATNEQFLGYVIIKQDRIPSSGIDKTRVYESVIKTSRHPNNCVHRQPVWKCEIVGNEFEVEGHLYAQQNNITNVCAHVALRTAASTFHPAGDMSYREMNKLVGIDHINRFAGGVGGDGLSSKEMVQILEAAGARCFVGAYTDPKNPPPVPFQKYLYGSIESGNPAIIFFGTTQNSYHAIPVFGHTFNEDTWVPHADFSYFKIGAGTQYIPSESWLSMFIAHDDNYGSNYCIPRRYLHSRKICPTIGPADFCAHEKEGVAYAIATVPKSVKLSPIRAEAIGVDYLFTILPQMPMSQVWDRRLKMYAQADLMVLRPVLISGTEYVAHLRIIRDWKGKRINRKLISVISKNLKDGYYWLVELSLPELFSANRRKVGEVLLHAETSYTSRRDFRNFTLARLPDHFAFYEGGTANPKYFFLPSGVHQHVELYGCEDADS